MKRNSENQFEIDLKNAKALLCAARIASDSMARAVHMAEADALRKVKEAVASKKRAREGLQEICCLEKARKVRDDDGSYGGAASQNHVANSNSASRGLTNFVSQNRPSNQGMVSDTGKITPAAPMNVDDAGNTSNANHRLGQSPSEPGGGKE